MILLPLIRLKTSGAVSGLADDNANGIATDLNNGYVKVGNANAEAVTTSNPPSLTINENASATSITLTGSDNYGNAVTYTIASNPSHGTLSVTSGNIVSGVRSPIPLMPTSMAPIARYCFGHQPAGYFHQHVLPLPSVSQ